jgi:hypothetical protein
MMIFRILRGRSQHFTLLGVLGRQRHELLIYGNEPVAVKRLGPLGIGTVIEFKAYGVGGGWRRCCHSLGAGLHHELKLNLEGGPGGYSVEDEAVHRSAIEWLTNPINELSHAFGVAFDALEHPEELGVGVPESRAFGEETAAESEPVDRLLESG